jgi:hypothetical protein
MSSVFAFSKLSVDMNDGDDDSLALTHVTATSNALHGGNGTGDKLKLKSDSLGTTDAGTPDGFEVM